ncbi:MAG: exodeoxyribonuclease VII small subunit [Rhodanobacteraceae bacterium]|nr:exodeoxyribonuclease VII small subunit [Pseudomonadota bacterium]
MPKNIPAPHPPSSETPAIAQFEQSLDELERLVALMENGELSLDESLRSFERGIALYRHCQTALEQAELRVKLLLDPTDPDSAQPFDSADP